MYGARDRARTRAVEVKDATRVSQELPPVTHHWVKIGVWSGGGPISDHFPIPNANSSAIQIKPNTFPTFTWFYLNQVFWDKPAFSGS
jgi:hypothetical protein